MSEVFYKKGAHKNFAKVAGKHLRQRPEALLKKRLCHWYFPVNLAKLLRTPFLQNTSGQLLLHMQLLGEGLFKYV